MMIEKGIKDHFDTYYILRDVVVVWFKTHWVLFKRLIMELHIYLALTKLALSKNCKASAFAGEEDRNLESLTLNITFKAMSLKRHEQS